MEVDPVVNMFPGCQGEAGYACYIIPIHLYSPPTSIVFTVDNRGSRFSQIKNHSIVQLHLNCLSLIYFLSFLCLQPFLPKFSFFSPKMYTIYTYQVRFFKLKYLLRVISLVFSPRSENTGTFSSLFAKFDCFLLHFVWFCL